VATLGLLLPVPIQRQQRFLYGRSAVGRTRFESGLRAKEVLRVCVGSSAILVAGGLAAAAACCALPPVWAHPTAEPATALAFSVGALLATLVVAGAYFRVGLHNAVWNGLRLGPHRFRSRQTLASLLALELGNLVASVATLGLFWLLEHPSEALHPVLGLLWRRERRVGAPATLAWLACSFGWIVALYSHATGALFVLSCSVVALARIALCPVDRGRFLASFGIANLVALVAFAPWLVRLVGQVGKFKQSFWATFPTLERIQRDAGDAFFFGSQPRR
jgi:hypothetical protein